MRILIYVVFPSTHLFETANKAETIIKIAPNATSANDTIMVNVAGNTPAPFCVKLYNPATSKKSPLNNMNADFPDAAPPIRHAMAPIISPIKIHDGLISMFCGGTKAVDVDVAVAVVDFVEVVVVIVVVVVVVVVVDVSVSVCVTVDVSVVVFVTVEVVVDVSVSVVVVGIVMVVVFVTVTVVVTGDVVV
jgi:hypothetical protein